MRGSALLERASPAPSSGSRTPLEEYQLSKDEVFNLLRNSRRRAALQYLLERECKATRSELAEHIAAVENGVTAAELNSAQRKRVYVSLYQNHLPKMDEYGVVTYDAREGTAELTPQAKALAHYLDNDTVRPEPGRWAKYSSLFGVFGLVSLALTALDQFVTVPPDVIVTTLLSLLLLVSIATTRRRTP
jgi:hypothetical protein